MKITLTATFILATACTTCWAEIFAVGAGSYTDDLADFDPEDHGPTFTPHVASDAPPPYPTSDWWTSVLSERYSRNLFAIPLAFRCSEKGLLVDRPGLLATSEAIVTPFRPDFRIGLEETNYSEAVASRWSDFTVDIQFPSEKGPWTATIGHGLPFAYALFSEGTPEINFFSEVKIIQKSSDALLVRVAEEVSYGIYFIGDQADLDEINPRARLRLPGCTYLAVATLPDETWFERFKPVAFQRVIGSQVDYDYDVDASEVTTTYRVETTPMRGDAAPTYLALFPHHYKKQNLKLTESGYDSIRGRLKLVHANQFTTVLPFHGLMPFFPEPTSDSYDPAHLKKLLEQVVSQEELIVATHDKVVLEKMDDEDSPFTHVETYFLGKQLAHIARLIPIADLSGNEAVKERLIKELRSELVDWFTATPGETEKYFYYDPSCGGLIGMNSSFYTYNYTDHHFHYGHFVYASAMLSLYDTAFKEDYGKMVELLILDYNSPDRSNPMLPHLRMMDPYEGHCWANGTGGWGEGLGHVGNDQESSSEAMHSWQAIFFWGMVTGNDRLRDHGAWGYVTEATATDQYYFDVDNDIYDNDKYEHEFVSLLFGGKAAYLGYHDFSEYTFGIQYLPITPSSLYLGYNPDHARQQYANFVRENGGVEDRWFDLLWAYQAFFDAEAALEKYDESVTIDHDGNSFANVYRWIHFFAGVGQVDVSIASPWPYYSVFRKGDRVTLLAYNPGNDTVEVPFRVRASKSPLTTLSVAPGSVAIGAIDAGDLSVEGQAGY